MDVKAKAKQFWSRASERIAGYVRAVLDRNASSRARLAAAAKAIASLAAALVVLMILYAAILIPFTPSIDDLRKAKIDQPSILISADGKRLAAFKPMNREWVRLNQISPHVINALIATEDHRFYEHWGIDLRRAVTGLLRIFVADPEGGSTITQQLARNLYPEQIGRQRTITRKIKETITAIKIEFSYTKREILETYLNSMPFLYNAYGIEMAARTYFDKSASKLSVLESATLIAMLKGTSYYNPVLNPERALRRRNVVLGQMVKRSVLPEAEFERLKNRPIRLNFERQQEAFGPAPHLALHIRKWLIDWAERRDLNIYSDGLIVHTTIDARLQAVANQAVHRQMEGLQAVADVEWGMSSDRVLSTSAGAYVEQRRRTQPFGYFWKTRQALVDSFVRESTAYRTAVEAGTTPEAALVELKANKDFMAKLRADKTRLEAGFVAIDPATGHVKAWVGSRDFKTDQFDHVAQARRQPGSTFKPFVYGAALEDGMPPDKTFIDREVEIPLPDGTVWRPSDTAPPSGRAMTAREGLIYSKNTITAQVVREVGPRRSADLARRMGVNQSRLDEVPSLALGTSPVTPLELVSAYATLAAGGFYRQPIFVTHVTDRDGNLLQDFRSQPHEALSDKTAGHLINMLRDAVDLGTGQAIRSRFGLRADVAGKTGTTQKNTDGWFVLMHPRLVAGAWVGFNDARVTMRSNYWGEGGHNAVLLVGDFFQQAIEARFVEGNAKFPYARPRDSMWDPYIDQAKDFFGAAMDWLFGSREKPQSSGPLSRESDRASRRDRFDGPEQQRRLEKDRLMERLRQKREEYERQQLEQDVYR